VIVIERPKYRPELYLLRVIQPNGNLDIFLCLNRGTPKCCLDLSNLSSGEMSASPLTTSADLEDNGRGIVFKRKPNF
jgi:hypothetical protein